MVNSDCMMKKAFDIIVKWNILYKSGNNELETVRILRLSDQLFVHLSVVEVASSNWPKMASVQPPQA